ncbi:MFS general substrate transporter [Amniculicola lignicola CBS 123094]|uniref:MFS general substrate transporter n=1 Tax=Amniculicola lignicola CBS 123094 TaxID=1392246 RepID=A0A6A5X102_9PLEO|nr:MFS general substrate transporter [Amniculicola lignicola CBS 123094]
MVREGGACKTHGHILCWLLHFKRLGSLIEAGILSGLEGDIGMSSWQWLSIVEGAIILPDFPDTWRRLAIDAAEADTDNAGGMSQIHGMKLAFLDPKTYILALAYMGITGSAGFQNLFPTLTATLGYSRIISLLLVAPPYVFMVFYSFGHCYINDKIGNRFWFLTYPVFIAIAGFVTFMSTDSFGLRYFSFFLMTFVFAQNGTIYAWISNGIPRPPAKRAAALAFINSIGNSASTWTPLTYWPSSAPHYRPALQHQNRQPARMENVDAELTEKDIKKFAEDGRD